MGCELLGDKVADTLYRPAPGNKRIKVSIALMVQGVSRPPRLNRNKPCYIQNLLDDLRPNQLLNPNDDICGRCGMVVSFKSELITDAQS